MLTPGAHCGQQGGGVIGEQEKGGVGRALLQQLEHGVLGAGVHGLGVLQDVDLAFGLVGPDVGVGAEGAHLGHADILPVVPHPHDVGVDAPLRLAAAGAGQAGQSAAPAVAHQGGGQQARQGPLAGARRAAEDVRVGEARRAVSSSSCRFSGALPASRVRFIKTQTRSNRSISTTKMVAPPTTTSTGMEG